MSDVIGDRVTIGPSADATFVTPELGLPQGFAMMKKGLRGHLLTLAPGMRGTICVEGIEHDVAHLVREGFHATAIGGLDWGVIELDAKLKIFFQFVGRDNVPVKPLFEQEPEQRASLAFSTLLHGALLFTTYQLYTHTESDTDPTRDLTAQYVVTRIEAQERPAVAMPAVTVEKTVKAPTPMPPSTWREINVTAPPKKGPPKPIKPDTVEGPPPKPSVFDGTTQQLFNDLTQKKNGVGRLGQVDGHGGPPGNGSPEVGPTTHGDGNGDGKQPHGQYKGNGDALDTGGMRKGVVCTENCGGEGPQIIPEGPPTQDDKDQLTEKDIARVINAAKARLISCYQKEMNRDTNLAGTVHMRFEISAQGTVSNVKPVSSTLHNEAVTDCLSERIAFLHFPAKSRAVVNYPFVFSAK